MNPLSPPVLGEDKGELRDTLRLPAAFCCTIIVLPWFNPQSWGKMIENGGHPRTPGSVPLHRHRIVLVQPPSPPSLGGYKKTQRGSAPLHAPMGGTGEAKPARNVWTRSNPFGIPLQPLRTSHLGFRIGSCRIPSDSQQEVSCTSC